MDAPQSVEQRRASALEDMAPSETLKDFVNSLNLQQLGLLAAAGGLANLLTKRQATFDRIAENIELEEQMSSVMSYHEAVDSDQY